MFLDESHMRSAVLHNDGHGHRPRLWLPQSPHLDCEESGAGEAEGRSELLGLVSRVTFVLQGKPYNNASGCSSGCFLEGHSLEGSVPKSTQVQTGSNR